MMNEAIVSTECNTLIPVCSSEIETPNPLSSSSTSSSTSIESSPKPSPNRGVDVSISSGAKGNRRLRTIACLISAWSDPVESDESVISVAPAIHRTDRPRILHQFLHDSISSALPLRRHPQDKAEQRAAAG